MNKKNMIGLTIVLVSIQIFGAILFYVLGGTFMAILYAFLFPVIALAVGVNITTGAQNMAYLKSVEGRKYK